MKDFVEFDSENYRLLSKGPDDSSNLRLYRKFKLKGDDRAHLKLMGKYPSRVDVVERLEQEGIGAPTTVVKCKYCDARLHVPTLLLGTPTPCLRCARVAIREV